MSKQVSKYRSRQAHEAAVREGYTGTLEEFRAMLLTLATATREMATEMEGLPGGSPQPVAGEDAFDNYDGFAIQAGIMLVERSIETAAHLRVRGQKDCECDECGVMRRYIAKVRAAFPKVVADIEADAENVAQREWSIERAFKEALTKNPSATAQQVGEYIAASMPAGGAISAVRIDKRTGDVDLCGIVESGPPRTGPEPGVN